MKVMLHVQHLLGIGHQQRAAAIAVALAQGGVDVVYATGGMAGGLPALLDGGVQQNRGPFDGRLRVVQLPPARAGDLSYSHLVDEYGNRVDDAWRARRREALLALFEAERPDVLLVETFPFGRKLLAFELIPLLDAALIRPQRPLVMCSVRDIIEPRNKASRYRQMEAQALKYVDRILVHSDPALIRLEDSFPASRDVLDKVLYTGFVAGRVPRIGLRRPDGRDEVLVSAGGGAVGSGLYDASVAAGSAALSATSVGRGPARLRWRILSGRQTSMSGARAQRGLNHRAGHGRSPEVCIEPNRPDFPALLARCKVSVSQAGYNTMVDILQARCRSIVVPYAQAGQKEQGIRARVLERRGLLRVLEASALNARSLAQAVVLAARSPRPPAAMIARAGAAVSAAEIIRLGRQVGS